MGVVGLVKRLAAYEDAAGVVRGAGLSCNRVVGIDTDSILYLNGEDSPRTLWLHRTEKELKTKMVAGFQVEPPAGWPD